MHWSYIWFVLAMSQSALRKELEETKLPDKLKFFEALSTRSGAPEGWLFGKVSVLFHCWQYIH